MKSVNTGIRLTPAQMEKLNRLAKALKTNRNHTIKLLIESAVIEQIAVIRIPTQEITHERST